MSRAAKSAVVSYSGRRATNSGGTLPAGMEKGASAAVTSVSSSGGGARVGGDSVGVGDAGVTPGVGRASLAVAVAGVVPAATRTVSVAGGNGFGSGAQAGATSASPASRGNSSNNNGMRRFSHWGISLAALGKGLERRVNHLVNRSRHFNLPPGSYHRAVQGLQLQGAAGHNVGVH